MGTVYHGRYDAIGFVLFFYYPRIFAVLFLSLLHVYGDAHPNLCILPLPPGVIKIAILSSPRKTKNQKIETN